MDHQHSAYMAKKRMCLSLADSSTPVCAMDSVKETHSSPKPNRTYELAGNCLKYENYFS